MHGQDGRASDSERASRHLPYNIVDMVIMMCCMYQCVSLETRTAATTSLGYLLFFLVSLFVTIVWFCYCAFVAFVLHTFVCTVAPPHHFLIFGSAYYTRYCVHAMLCELVLIVHRILFTATNCQFPTERIHLAANER